MSARRHRALSFDRVADHVRCLTCANARDGDAEESLKRGAPTTAELADRLMGTTPDMIDMRPAPLGRIRASASAGFARPPRRPPTKGAARTGAHPVRGRMSGKVGRRGYPSVAELGGVLGRPEAMITYLRCDGGGRLVRCCGFSAAAEEVEHLRRGCNLPIRLRAHHVKGARVGQVGERILTGRVRMEEVDRAEHIHFESESSDVVVPAP